MYRIHEQYNRPPVAFNPPLVLISDVLGKINGNLGRFGLIGIISLGAYLAGTSAVTAQSTIPQLNIPPTNLLPPSLQNINISDPALERTLRDIDNRQREAIQQQQQSSDRLFDSIMEDARIRREARQRRELKFDRFHPTIRLRQWE